MGEVLTGAALLALPALTGLALTGALLTRAWRHRRRRVAGRSQATEQTRQLAGTSWTAAWQAHVRLAQLEDRVAALEAELHPERPRSRRQPDGVRVQPARKPPGGDHR